MARIDIGNFAASNYIDGIDGKLTDGSTKFASSPNGRSPPMAKGKRDASCLDAFKMFSLEEHRLCQSLRAQLIREIEKVFCDNIVLTRRRNGRGFSRAVLEWTVDEGCSQSIFLS